MIRRRRKINLACRLSVIKTIVKGVLKKIAFCNFEIIKLLFSKELENICFKSYNDFIWLKRKILNTVIFLTDYWVPSSNLPKILYDFDEQIGHYIRENGLMSTLIYVSRQFWSFISSRMKRNNYERPNNHHIVKISDISLQIIDMNLRTLNQYPNTDTIFAKLLLCS